MIPVVFLDIDGVIVNRMTLKGRSGLRAVADPACVECLNRITEATAAAIVLSSSWRFCGIEEMRLILTHWGVEAPLVSMTPDLTRQPEVPGGLYTGVPRGREIQAWIDEHGRPKGFAIIDDNADMEHLSHYLVKTESRDGLMPKDIDLAITLIKRGMVVDEPVTTERKHP
jgi:hypothetical protein